MRDDLTGNVRIGFLNYALAVVIGSLVALAIYTWGVPGIDPSLWNEVAEAAGVRPPREVFPGFWRLVASQAFHLFGLKSGVSIL